MNGFEIDIDKALNALLFVASELGESADLHKTFKILYFADQKHLIDFGRPVVGDTYVKMDYGPVPSCMSDMVKGNLPMFKDLFEIYDKYYIKLFSEPNLDYLSETDIECLRQSLIENKDLGFWELYYKSHDYAWNNAAWTINYIDIFKAKSKDKHMLNYIKTNMENNSLQL